MYSSLVEMCSSMLQLELGGPGNLEFQFVDITATACGTDNHDTLYINSNVGAQHGFVVLKEFQEA